jgi:hypothetical protein
MHAENECAVHSNELWEKPMRGSLAVDEAAAGL